jgi:hypothetical protein
MAGRLWQPLIFVIVLTAIAVDFWHRPQPIGIDFHTYMAAARVGLEDGWSHIYDQALVAAQQTSLAPNQRAQPFLSPPPVAWAAATLAGLPFKWAYLVWAILTICAMGAAVAWTGTNGLRGRALALVVVVGTVWVLQADYLGQVVLLVAAGLVVTWRLLREDHEVTAGLVLVLVLFKPNTVFLVPACLLASGRLRTFVTWIVASAVAAGLVLATTGSHELISYIGQLQHPPPGTDALTLEAALGVGGPAALALRVAIVGVVLVGAWRVRFLPGLVIALGIIGSLLITPYIHLVDLCLLAAAGWITWGERASLIWRLPLAASWLLASPLVDISGLGPRQNRWPLLELGWLIALGLGAWRIGRHHVPGPEAAHSRSESGLEKQSQVDNLRRVGPENGGTIGINKTDGLIRSPVGSLSSTDQVSQRCLGSAPQLAPE